MKQLYSGLENLISMRKKGVVPIDVTAILLLKVIGAVFFLSITIGLLMSQTGGMNMCVGPFKQFYAGIADSTGVDMCTR